MGQEEGETRVPARGTEKNLRAGGLKELEGACGRKGAGAVRGARAWGMQGAAWGQAWGNCVAGGSPSPTEQGEGGGRAPPKPLPGVGQREVGQLGDDPIEPALLQHGAQLGYSDAARRVSPKAAPLEGAGAPVPTGLTPTEGAGGASGPGPALGSQEVPGRVCCWLEDKDHPGEDRSVVGELRQWGACQADLPQDAELFLPISVVPRNPPQLGAPDSCQSQPRALLPWQVLVKLPLPQRDGSGQSQAWGTCSASPPAHPPSCPSFFLAPNSSPAGSSGASTLVSSMDRRVSCNPPRH